MRCDIIITHLQLQDYTASSSRLSIFLCLICRLYVSKMSWNVTSQLSLGMQMQKYINVKMSAVLDQCVTSELINWELRLFIYLSSFSIMFILLCLFSTGHMEVEKKMLLCVMYLNLRMPG